jgi:hypothetical protein
MKTSFLALTLLCFIEANAQWNANPIINKAVCTLAGNQNTTQSVSDGNGGILIVWNDDRAGNSDIYAQKLDANGIAQWAANGVLVCGNSTQQYVTAVVSDGNGGVIISWLDYRNDVGFTNRDAYAQRMNNAGIALWAADGVPVSTYAGDQVPFSMVAFGTGAIICWEDYRNINPNSDIYAQFIDGNGNAQWAVNGVAICNAAKLQLAPQMITDGTSSVMFVWQDARVTNYTYDIYAQRVNASGVAQWAANGIAICTANGSQGNVCVVSDGGTGAIICWNDFRYNVANDIFCQKINAAGVSQWTADGVPVCTAFNDQAQSQAIADGAGGMIMVWLDYRNGAGFSTKDIYAQKINASGTAMWTLNGQPISVALGTELGYKIVSNGSGGCIVTWHDNRTGNNDVYAQQLNSSGSVLWLTNGMVIGNAANDQEYATSISDNNGGAILAWADNRNSSNYDIYSSRLFSNGTLPLNNLELSIAKMANANVLQWNANEQIAPAYFDIEISYADYQFKNLFRLYPGTTPQMRYSFTDQKLVNEYSKLYYRVKQMGVDGNYTVSNIVTVIRDKQKKAMLYPNPVSSILHFSVGEVGKTLVLTDNTGKEVERIKITKPFSTISIQQLSAAVYYLNYDGQVLPFVKR